MEYASSSNKIYDEPNISAFQMVVLPKLLFENSKAMFNDV